MRQVVNIVTFYFIELRNVKFFLIKRFSVRPEAGQGFGLEICTRSDVGINPALGSVDSLYRSGIYGMSFWVDPKEQLAVVNMMNARSEAQFPGIIRNYVYQALMK